jgi:acetyl esterase/lipase
MWSLENIQWACIRAIVNTHLHISRSAYFSPATQPNQVKVYPCRPNLYASRIFIPPGHDAKTPLPLVIRVHGGGFIMNAPALDDPMARHLADNANCIVISIDYSKSPNNKFPTAYEDVVAQILAIIEDTDLSIDPKQVVLCGSSAGGNLVLGAAQDKRLQSKVMGVVGIYPPVDMSEDGPTKMATRPDPSIPDFIGDSFASVARFYLEETQKPSLTDIRLSPANFTSREDLPANILLLGVEHDMFCHEGEAMASKLAGDGTTVNSEAGWQAPGVQWHKISGQTHAFDNFPAKTSEKERARVEAVQEMYAVISEWLVNVFSPISNEYPRAV